MSSMIGSQIKKAVDPANKKKVATFSVFEPTASETSETILEDFKENQNRMFALIESLNETDLEKVIVTPVSSMVTISVGDALQVLVSHEHRHFEQAKGVTEMDGFPK